MLVHEESDLGRSILAALSDTSSQAARASPARKKWTVSMAQDDILFGVEITTASSTPCGAHSSRALVRPDATDPPSPHRARCARGHRVERAGARPACRNHPDPSPPSIVSIGAYDPGRHQPRRRAGLLGTILTMTMIRTLSVARGGARRHGKPARRAIRPLEVMIGEILAYVFIGFIPAALVLSFGALISMPVNGSVVLLAALRHAVHRRRPVDRLRTFSTIAEPAPGDPDVVHVLPANIAVGLHVVRPACRARRGCSASSYR